jgi:peptide/nickel transport system permease protein
VPDLNHVAQAPFGPGRHWLGTDLQGRDVLSVLVFGARTAVLLTLPAALFSALLGAVSGGAAGFWGNRLQIPLAYWVMGAAGGWWAVGLPFQVVALALALVGTGLLLLQRTQKKALLAFPLPLNAVVMGAATTLDTIPRLVLVVAVAAGTGVSAVGLLALLTLTAWSHPARLVRAQMLRVRSLPFVESAEAAGVSSFWVWLKHALPHAIQPLRTAFPLSIASLLGLESTLSFLSIGLPPNVASWGRLLGAVREEPAAWWIFIFPCICLSCSILSLHSLSRNR